MIIFRRAHGQQSWRIALEPIPSFIDWYKAHKISGTLLLAAFVIAKGYVLARGDTTTAQGIAQYAGVTTVVIAAALSSVPLLAAAMLAISCYQMVYPLFGTLVAGWREQLVVSTGALAISAVVTRLPFTVGAIVFGFLFGALQRLIEFLDNRARNSRHDRTRGLFWASAHSVTKWVVRIFIFVGSLSAALAILYTVWLPNEIVAFKPNPNGPQVVAYILAEDPGGRITLLTSSTRQIVSFRDKDVTSVTACRPTPHGGLTNITEASTLWAWVTSRSRWGPLHDLHPAVPPQPCGSTKHQHGAPGQSVHPH